MIRALVCAVLMWGAVCGSLSQAQAQAQIQTSDQMNAIERRMVQALVQKNPDAVRQHVATLERLIDAGIRKDGWTAVAQYGLLAEVMFQLGDVDETVRFYAKAAQAAQRDGAWTSAQGLGVRYELGNTLLLQGRADQALAVGQDLLADLRTAGAETTEAGMNALVLVGMTQLERGAPEMAATTMRQLLAIATQHDPAQRFVELASNGLARALSETGDVTEAAEHTRRATEIALRTHAPDSEDAMIARLRLGMALEKSGDLAQARALSQSVLDDANRLLPPSHEIAQWARRTLELIERAEGRKFAARALNLDISDQEATNADPVRAFDGMMNRAAHLFANGDFAAYERAMVELLSFAGKHPDIPAPQVAGAMRAFGNFMLDQRGDLDQAHQMLTDAVLLLIRALGPDHLETLRAEADWIFTKRIEVETEEMWRQARRLPTFWDGTQAGKTPTARDIEIFRKLAMAERQSGARDEIAVVAAMNYVDILVRANRYDDALNVMKSELTRQQQAYANGAPRRPQIDYAMVEGLGSMFLKSGRFEQAADVFANGVDEVLRLLRGTEWLGSIGGGDFLYLLGQSYGQAYAMAALRASQFHPDDPDETYAAMVFEAVQMAGYGPASAAVARASVRAKAQDPELRQLVSAWQDAAFRNTANSGHNRSELDQLRRVLEARFPEYLQWQVPGPIPLTQVQRDLIAKDEAIIAILPATGASGQTGALNGLVVAVTRDKAVFAELSVKWSQLAFDIMRLHGALDPGGSAQFAALRAPMASLTTQSAAQTTLHAPFEFGAAHRLYQAFFGAPQIHAVIADKTTWTLVPFGETLGVPFSALVVEDPSDGLSNHRTPADLRAVRWLGHERALNVVPSVAALADLRSRPRHNPDRQTEYVAFGDPDFAGSEMLSSATLPSSDTVLRGTTNDRAKAVRGLPRLPGTRREVETLAQMFGAGSSQIFLGAEASKSRLLDLDKHGAFAQVGILHIATHGLLSGAFEGLAEPALALSPDASKDSDGLLTASEAARMTINADWVILSACDTAGPDSIAGDGLGGLVQGFFGAGANNLLVSHWRVDDRAAETLITQTVTDAYTGISKAAALRKAMRDLAADQSRDRAPLSNAHPSIWAPFLLVGAG